MKRSSIVSLVLSVAGAVAPHPLISQQPTFAVATIRPSAESVPFTRDGDTRTFPGTIRMRDVTVNTCIKWAYGVQDSQVAGPDWLKSDHFDITAKSDEPVPDRQMKAMMQLLLADRFKLSFHREKKELKAFALIVAKGGPKFHESQGDGPGTLQNSANGTTAKAATMQEFTDLLSSPLRTPVVDETGLGGKYDFVLDFTSYLPEDMKTMRADATNILMAALPGELGLKLEPRKLEVEVIVIDHIEKPSEN